MKNFVHVEQGDCLQVMKQIPDGAVDMVFADLPYGVTRNKWDSVIPFGPLWEQLLRVGKERCTFVFTATQPFATALINSQPKMFRYDLVWNKKVQGSFGLAKHRPLPFHENVLVFGKGSYNPQMTKRDRPVKGSVTGGKDPTQNIVRNTRGKVFTDKYPTSILDFPVRDKYRGLHPTQKPVALLEWLVKTYSNPGDLILDPTMGSGTTGVACVNTERSFIGIEQDEKYFQIACNRLNQTEADFAARK